MTLSGCLLCQPNHSVSLICSNLCRQEELVPIVDRAEPAIMDPSGVPRRYGQPITPVFLGVIRVMPQLQPDILASVQHNILPLNILGSQPAHWAAHLAKIRR